MEAIDLKHKGHIVIIDDSEEMRNLCSDFFMSYGFQTTVFENARKAWEKLSNDSIFASSVDVILSDIHMPEMDGYGLLMKVRQKLPKVPVVLMTGYGSEAGSKAAISEGAFKYISKPFQLFDLKSAIDRAISYKQWG